MMNHNNNYFCTHMSKETDTGFEGFKLLNQEVEVTDLTPAEIVIPKAEGEIKEIDPKETAGEIIKPEKQIITPKPNEKETEQEETVLDNEVSTIKVFTDFLVEKDVIEIPENFEKYDEEGLTELVQYNINKGIEDYKNSKNETAKQLIEFLDNGGKVEDFIQVYSGTDYDSVDVEKLTKDESLQKSIIVDLLKNQGYSPEEINQELVDYIDGGILTNKAKRALTKLQSIQEEQKANLVELQKQQQKELEKQEREFFEGLKTTINSQEELLGFKLTNKEKEDFYQYITKVDKKTGKTSLQKDIEADKDAQLKQAWMMYKKFDVSSIKEQAKKTAVVTLAQKLGKAGTKANNYSRNGGNQADFVSFAKMLNI